MASAAWSAEQAASSNTLGFFVNFPAFQQQREWSGCWEKQRNAQQQQQLQFPIAKPLHRGGGTFL